MVGDLTPFSLPVLRYWWCEHRVLVFPVSEDVHCVRMLPNGHPCTSYTISLAGLTVDQYVGYVDHVVRVMKRRKSERESVLGSAGELSDPEFQRLYPCLWDMLTADHFEDGSSRKTTSILMFKQEGRLKLMLRDKEEGECAWLSGTSVEGLLASAEAGLAAGKLDWRMDKEVPPRPRQGPAKRS